MDWGAVIIGCASGVAAAITTVAVIRTDVRWLKEQVKAIWHELDKIAPRPVIGPK